MPAPEAGAAISASKPVQAVIEARTDGRAGQRAGGGEAERRWQGMTAIPFRR
jgi:hypothetical protein